MEMLAKQDTRDGNLTSVTAEVSTVSFTAAVTAIQAYSATLNTTRYTLGTLSHDIRNLLNTDVTIAGCTDAKNDGTFRVIAVSAASSYIYVVNMDGVAQAGAAGAVAATFVINALHTQPIGTGVAADEIQGNILHDSADGATKPVKVGGKALSALPAAVNANDRVNAYFDLYGRQVIAGSYLEDEAHNSGDWGVQALAVRKDTEATIATADGDYSPLQVTATGKLRVEVKTETSAVITVDTTPTDFTANWAQLGSEIDMRGYNTLLLYGVLDINDSTNARIRVVGRHTSLGTDYPVAIETVSSSDIKVEAEYIEFNVDADQNMILKVKTDGIPYVAVQIQAGAVGASAGHFDSVYATKAVR